MNEITIIDTAEIGKTITANELKGASADELQATFAPIFEAAKQWREKAAGIKVTNIAQTAVMGEARKTRFEIKAVRINAEKAKDRLKADSLRYGRAVQGLYNTIIELTEPVEKYLLDQEEYGKRLQEKFQAEERERNTMEAGKYIEFFPPGIDLGTVGEEHFKRHFDLAKTLWNAREAENAKAEKERIEKEQREAAEREAMRVENERLRADAAKVEAQRAKEREAVRRAEAEYNAKLAAERAEVNRLRREAEDKELAETLRVETELRAKREAEKDELEAPDKEKLLRYCDHILAIEIPKIQSETLNQKLAEAKSLIRKAIQLISEP